MTLDAAAMQQHKEWMGASPSTLMSHGACCDRAKSWLIAMGRSFDFAATDGFGLTAPRWLASRYNWGPTQWPAHWCEAVRAETIDCGVFSAFAREILTAKGVEVYAGQVLRSYARESTTHWREKWAALPGAFNWIGDDVVYHEVCIVRTADNTCRIYDPTDGQWLDPDVAGGHLGHVAVRGAVPVSLKWGHHMLSHNQWTEMLPL